ncbi:MAG: hypothetical protein IIT59_05380, partial [Rhodocyclaceae bacterium]|nr:hypothetical protein [Rhodocyclaceae bacterium]
MPAPLITVFVPGLIWPNAHAYQLTHELALPALETLLGRARREVLPGADDNEALAVGAYLGYRVCEHLDRLADELRSPASRRVFQQIVRFFKHRDMRAALVVLGLAVHAVLVQDINHKPHDERLCLRGFNAAYVEDAVLIEQLFIGCLLAREDVFVQSD